MKKSLALLATIILAGCAQATSPAATTAQQETPEAVQEETAEEPQDRLQQIWENGVIVLATSPDYAPFTFMDPRQSGQDAIVGADIALARFIAQRLGVELEIQPMDFSASLAAIQLGTADLNIGGLAWTEERTQSMMLSSGYNFGEGFQGIIIRTERAQELDHAEAFGGLTIGAQNASLQYSLLTEQLPEANPQLVSAIPEGILMVLGGQLDGMVIPSLAGENFIANYDTLVMSDFRFEQPQSAGNVIAMPLGSYQLYEEVEDIIAYVIENGLYSTWMEEALVLAEELALD